MTRKSRKLSPSEKKCKIFQSSLKEVIRIAKKSGQKAKKSASPKKGKGKGKRSFGNRKSKKSFLKRQLSNFNSYLPRLPFTKSRFGSGAHGMPQNLLGMMGNNPSTEMSFSQSYTGMSPFQADVHMSQVPESLRTNFYSPEKVEYNPTYPPEI